MSQEQLDTDHRQKDALTPREFTNLWLRQRSQTEAGEPPELGTLDFIRLSDADPRKTAAVFRAAAAWFHHTDPATIESDLLDELEALAAMREEHLDRQYRRAVRINTAQPSLAEVRRRRREANAPRPNDYPGGAA